ncbi:Malonyl CoA-acyl carrier protein transacylase [compost metagenome]
MGEYTALTCAGVLKFADALRLVRERGRLMMEASATGNGRMLAISGIHADQAVQMIKGIENLDKRPVIACFNSSQQIVLSGTNDAVTAAEELLSVNKVKLSELKVSGAFHSPLMAVAADELEELLKSCTFGEFDFPVISNIEAKPYPTKGEDIIRNLKRQMTESVRWQQTMTCLLRHSIDAAVELAPRKTLMRLFKTDYPDFPVFSLDAPVDRQAVLSPSFVTNYRYSKRYLLEQCLAAAVSVRNRCKDDQVYKEQVVAPYRQLESLLLSLEKNNAEPSAEQLQDALNGLKTIIRAKGGTEEDCLYPRIEMERMLS